MSNFNLFFEKNVFFDALEVKKNAKIKLNLTANSLSGTLFILINKENFPSEEQKFVAVAVINQSIHVYLIYGTPLQVICIQSYEELISNEPLEIDCSSSDNSR